MSAFNRNSHAIEGAFASFNPRFQILAGPYALVGEPNGVAIGRFGWADLNTGLVYSAQQAPENVLGFVYRPSLDNQFWPTYDWRRTYWDCTRLAWISRGGFELTLARRGDFWARFDGGAYVGQDVYANVLDGSCVAFNRGTGPVTGYVQTPWRTVREAAPGCLSIISSWSTFT